MEAQLLKNSTSGVKLGRSLVKHELKNEEVTLKLKARAAEIIVYKVHFEDHLGALDRFFCGL